MSETAHPYINGNFGVILKASQYNTVHKTRWVLIDIHWSSDTYNYILQNCCNLAKYPMLRQQISILFHNKMCVFEALSEELVNFR